MVTKRQLWNEIKRKGVQHNLVWQNATKAQLQKVLDDNVFIFEPKDNENIPDLPRKKIDNPKVEIARHKLPERFNDVITPDNVLEIFADIKDFVMFYYNHVKQDTAYYNITLIGGNHNNKFTYTGDIKELLAQVKYRLTEYAEFYQEAPLVLEHAEFEYMRDAKDIIRATEEAITKANDTWYIVDTPTKQNCVFVAIKTCLYFKTNFKIITDKDYRVKHGWELKWQLKQYNIKTVEYDDLKELARILHINLNVYNEAFDLTDQYHYDDNKLSQDEVNIMITDNHAKALIKKDEILKIKPDFDFPTITYKKDHYYEKLIFSKEPHKEKDTKIVAWDCETYLIDQEKSNFIGSDKKFIVYASGLALMNGDELEEHYEYGGENNLDELFDFVALNAEFFDGYTFYAHNGGKFDIILLLRDVLTVKKDWKILTKGLIDLNSSIVAISVQYKEYTFHFRDSYRMFQNSLKDITRDFEVENQKGDIDHRSINKDNYMQKKDEVLKYLKNDVVGLLQVLLKFNDIVFDTFGINITRCITSASLAKKIFYLPKYCFTKHGLYSPSDFVDEFIRKGYMGGRCEAFKLGEISDVYYYDFTSLYPSVGCYPLPVGTAHYVPDYELRDIDVNTFLNRLDTSYYENDKRMGFVRVMVKGTKDDLKGVKPLHGIKQDGKLIFPYFEEWQEMTLFTREIARGVKLGYKYKLIDAVLYNRNNIMIKFFKDCFENKQKAKAEGKKAIELMWKIIINSGYGFWGFNPHNKDSLKLYKNANWKIPLKEKRLKSLKELDNGDVFATVKSNARPFDTNVAIAAAITSYARMKLHELMTDIEANNGTVYYCDTDSVMTNFDLSSSESMSRKWRKDGSGKSLGSLKNELGLDSNGRDLKFDKVTIVGCKAYSLELNGEPWSSKLKGYKKMDSKGNMMTAGQLHDAIKKLNSNEVVEQYQMMILCNKQDYMTTGFELRYTENEDRPKKFIKKYTKGHVDHLDGVVTPFTLSEPILV